MASGHEQNESYPRRATFPGAPSAPRACVRDGPLSFKHPPAGFGVTQGLWDGTRNTKWLDYVTSCAGDFVHDILEC